MPKWVSAKEMMEAVRASVSEDQMAKAFEAGARAALTKKDLAECILSETDAVRVVSTTATPQFGETEPVFWVHWVTTRLDEEDWPGFDPDYVFSRVTTTTQRIQTWAYPSLRMVDALVRCTWGIELVIPASN
jgi:hypothetical protein